MRTLCVFFFAAAALAAQTPDETQDAKPDPVKKARELLDGAAEMLGGAQPQMQAAGLWHLGENYRTFDKKKAVEFYNQAFAACPALPPQQAAMYAKRLQTEIVSSLADIDVDAATAMVKQIGSSKGDAIYDTRRYAIQRIVVALLAKSQFDKAIALIEGMGGAGVYSFVSADMVMTKLPEDDPRRLAFFSSALAAFDLRPNEEFRVLLASHWKHVTANVAGAALRSYLNFVLDEKKSGADPNDPDAKPRYQTLGIATAKGTVFFNSPEEHNLFDVMWIVREIDRKRADEILQKYPELKASLELYPKGMESMRSDGPSYSFSVTSGDKTASAQRLTQQARMQSLLSGQRLAAMETVEKDPEKALELARAISSTTEQTAVITAAARSMGEKDPTKARSVLHKCMAAVSEIKDPGERIQSWDAIAQSAAVISDDKLANEALERGLADAAELYKLDEEDIKDMVIPEYWPSTQAYRRIMMRAAKVLKTDAEPLLLKIVDPNMNLVARIALAQALLGNEPKMWQPYQARRRPRK